MSLTGLFFISFLLGLILAWLMARVFYSYKISVQTKKMIQVMKSDELKLNWPEDAYKNQDGDFFSDLERAAFHLRRKYLRLKKNAADERAVFETLFSGLKEAVVTVNSDLKLISFNSAFMRQFNWAPTQNNKPSFLHDVVRDPEVLNSFKKIFSKEVKSISTQNGSFDLFVSELPSVEDYPDWALGVFYDTTEIHKTERIRIDFIANASHELRTPLTIIRGFSDLLHQRLVQSNSDLIELSRPIAESSHNMTLLLNDLLNLSKLDHQNKIEKVKLNTKEITFEILNELESLIVINHKKIKCNFLCDVIFADESGLTQILRNLIVNAIKYSGQEKPAETIELNWHKKNSKVYLSVKDFGPGIPLDHQDRIFERFYRVDKGRNRDKGGSGLGLALVKHHVMTHGGQIQLYSDSNKGCEFVCEFPES